LAADLLEKFEPEIEAITLIPSSGGVYEITVNNSLIYSKKTIGRHAEPGEVVGLFEKFIKEGQK
jgi:selenoprotein W-related protein